MTKISSFWESYESDKYSVGKIEKYWMLKEVVYIVTTILWRINHHAWKIYVGVEVSLHAFLVVALDVDE